jgi:hypothetical protein
MRYHDPRMNKVKLRGKLKGTVSWVEIKTDGGLRLEFFDYSEDAQVFLGHDVAYLIHLSPEEKRQVMAFLNIGENDLTHPDVMLLERIEESFADYFEFKEWLDAHGISYQKEFDAMA